MTIKVFVYGTLKEGYPLDGYCLKERKKITKNVKVDGTLFNIGPFPGVKFNTGGKVIGEIHEFENPEKVLKTMDGIEGYNPVNEKQSLFIRRMITIPYNNKEVEAYAYEFNFETYEIEHNIIKTGIWEEN